MMQNTVHYKTEKKENRTHVGLIVLVYISITPSSAVAFIPQAWLLLPAGSHPEGQTHRQEMDSPSYASPHIP